MKIYIIIITLIISGFVSGQDLTCADFKNGNFHVAADETLPLGYKIVRDGDSQIEIVEDPDNILDEDFSKVSYEIIEWIDDCTYRLKYDESKMKLSDYQQFLNENDGILTELIKIEGNCFYVKSTLDVNGNKQIMESKICAEIIFY